MPTTSTLPPEMSEADRARALKLPVAPTHERVVMIRRLTGAIIRTAAKGTNNRFPLICERLGLNTEAEEEINALRKRMDDLMVNYVEY